MQVTHKLTDEIILGFEWKGGPYIDVCRGQAYATPKDVINVWDYRAGKARIPYTRENLFGAIHQWIADYGESNLIHDVTHNWR